MFYIKRKKHKDTKVKNGIDRNLLILTFILLVIGIIFLADASAPKAINDFQDKYYFVKQQMISIGVGISLMFIVSFINYKFWEKWAIVIFFIFLVSLCLVLIPGIGMKLLGAKRWINIMGISVQPSEFVKLSLAIYLARVASKGKKILSFILPVILVATVTMLQPDLGSTIIILALGMSQIFISGVNFLYFSGMSIIGFIIGMMLILVSDYRRERLMTYLQQTQDPLGKGYHIRQILYALGMGGLTGVGLGQSRQKYLFLPETATDSILAVIAEEIGFIWTLLIIILYLYMIFRIIKIGQKTTDVFGKVLAIGISSWLGVQILINISSIVALVPLTGVPLPFISYGGSAMVSNLIGIGIILNMSKNMYGKK